jgi:hypothetical protein
MTAWLDRDLSCRARLSRSKDTIRVECECRRINRRGRGYLLHQVQLEMPVSLFSQRSRTQQY